MQSNIDNRIINYLANGGLFNPELMEHDKVRDLLMDCYAELGRFRDTLKITLDNLVMHNVDYHHITDPTQIAKWRELL